MSTLADVAQAMQTVLTTDAAVAARENGFCRRASKLDGPRFAQTMILGCLAEPLPTLEGLAQMAATCGAAVQPQAIDQRLTAQAADFLRAVLAAAVRQVIVAEPAAVPLLRRFAGVHVEDSTTVALPDVLAGAWPGCRGRTAEGAQAAVKFQARLDLCTGALAGPWPEPGRASDQNSGLGTAGLAAGSVRITDLGYFDLDDFAGLHARGVYWLSRLQDRTAVFAGGRRVEPGPWLESLGRDVIDEAVELGVGHRLAARLIAVRVPPDVAQVRRARLVRKAHKKGRKPSAERLALAEWNIHVTNLPAELATTAEVVVLGRLRWQIELLFKLWKSEGRLDECRSEKPYRVLCEVFAKMTAQVVQHWMLIVGSWHEPARSLRKASAAVRRQCSGLATALGDIDRVISTIGGIVRALSVSAKVAKRRGRPSAFQLLQAPTIYRLGLS